MIKIEHIKAIRGRTYLGIKWNTVYILHCSIAKHLFKIVIEQGKNRIIFVIEDSNKNSIIALFPYFTVTALLNKLTFHQSRMIANKQKIQFLATFNK